MTADHRLGTVTAVDTTAVTADVTVDGTTVTAAVLCQMPQLTQTVWVELRGRFQQDWVITGIQDPPTARAIGFGRYAWTRTATGVANSAFIDIGTPPTTPWSTGSIVSSTTTRISITKDCFIALYATYSGQFVATLNILSAAYAYTASTQGGGLYQNALQYSGLTVSGEVLDIVTRNTSGSLANLGAKSFVTFCDAYAINAAT